jgi:hypothetical protein
MPTKVKQLRASFGDCSEAEIVAGCNRVNTAAITKQKLLANWDLLEALNPITTSLNSLTAIEPM